MSKRKHTRILTRKKSIDKTPETIIIKTTANNPVGKGILYPVHIKNATLRTPERKKLKKEQKTVFYKGTRTTDEPSANPFYLSEDEMKASISAYDLNEFLRPTVREHQENYGKNIDINFMRTMDEHGQQTVDTMITLLTQYEGWNFKPAKTNTKKLRKQLEKEG